MSRCLAVAFTMYEDGLCSCGQPRARAWNPDSEGQWETTSHVCQACAVTDRERRTKGRAHVHGEHLGVYDVDPTTRLRPPPRPV